jgi:uncharacterized protein (TIRG00374 family)
MDYSHKQFMQRRTLIQFSLGFLFSGIFLYLFLKNFDFKSLPNILSQLVYYNFAWVFLATAAHLFVKAIRWKIILAPLQEITVISSLSNVVIGLMANNLLPARSGELVRVASLTQTEEISASSVLSALILERLLDGYILLLFFMLSSYHVNLIQASGIMPNLQKAALAAFILYSSVLLGLMIFMKYGTSQRFEKIVPVRLKFLALKLNEFKAGLDILRDFKRMVHIFLLSVIVWLLSAFIIMATLSMFLSIQSDIYSYIGYMESIFLNGSISLALLLPAAPGFFGSFHWICSLALLGFGLTNTLADSFAVFIHGSQYILITSLGLIFFANSHMNFRKIFSAKPL